MTTGADELRGQIGHRDQENFPILREMKAEGQSLLIVIHDPRLAQRCDRILELVNGHLVSDKPSRDVVHRG